MKKKVQPQKEGGKRKSTVGARKRRATFFFTLTSVVMVYVFDYFEQILVLKFAIHTSDFKKKVIVQFSTKKKPSNCSAINKLSKLHSKSSPHEHNNDVQR